VKIFSAAQFRNWDAVTISNEPVSSIDLMERAAEKCTQWIIARNFHAQSFTIFCGKGNNGGDGLAIARLLLEKQKNVSVFIIETVVPGSSDFETNLQRLPTETKISWLSSPAGFPKPGENTVVIDAIFGTGLNKPPEGVFSALISFINNPGGRVVSIDMPSGLYADESSLKNTVVHASYTLTFQSLKLAFMMAENAAYMGEVHVLDLGLDKNFYETEKAGFYLTESADVKKVFRKRNRFSHKGDFGHALLVAGSYGKMGAAVLAAKACVHGGTGLLTCHIPRCGYTIMQTSVPEAMADMDDNEYHLTTLRPGLSRYNATGIGPGIGTDKSTRELVASLLKNYGGALIIDADALNCIAADPSLISNIPPLSILTPHPKEFDRLFGDHENEFARIHKAMDISHKNNIIIVLKGHHTLVATPNGGFFNSTGNAGMAKGGSGDVLTGIITSLLAQKYSAHDAAVLGCYLHGLAGDEAADALTEEYITAGDIVNFLPAAFRQIKDNC
jgi:ADP-dependent NAD(P)H-hydrate dehydratase / NAD(P)H-hydrate epimerase